MIGKTISHYKILEKLGEGGMGVVYKAEDSKLARTVALKFLLPQALGSEEERSRFIHEARSAASLSHPNICTVHEIDEANAQTFIAMEYIEGESLRDKIESGPLKLKEAIEIATQIAGGLAEAHQKGIVHRDVKPANIMITAKGQAKVMDFGIAKSSSRTMMTKEGTTLGTVAYMSPEQVRGDAVDGRSDIWSVGALLYEMVTGVQAFKGGYEQAIVYSILNGEPEPMTGMRTGVPMELERIVAKALAKEPDDRYQHIEEMPVDLRAVNINTTDVSKPTIAAVRAAARPARISRRRTLAYALGALVLGILLGVASTKNILLSGAQKQKPVTRFTVRAPAGLVLGRNAPSLAISPDGRTLVFTAGPPGGPTSLYKRGLDQLDAAVIPGTEDAGDPFFSPDGGWVAFQAGGTLKKVPLSGGAPMTICEAKYPGTGAAWEGDDGIILPLAGSTGLVSVKGAADTFDVLTTPNVDGGDICHRRPFVLPGGRELLFTTVAGTGRPRLDALNLKTMELTSLLQGVTRAQYVNAGYLVYAQAGGLRAVRFNPKKLEIAGAPVPVLDAVYSRVYYGVDVPFFAVSSTGNLAYVPGTAASEVKRIVAISRTGEVTPFMEDQGDFRYPALSPDGAKLAVSEFADKNSKDIWIYDVERGTRTRLKGGGFTNLMARWTPDGGWITYACNKSGPMSMFWKPADGSGEARQLLPGGNSQFPESWSPDGRTLAFTELSPETGGDIYTLSVGGPPSATSAAAAPPDGESMYDSTAVTPFVVTPYYERSPRFSPDGKWIAYASDESGQYEIYIRPFPGPGGVSVISTEGGRAPVWSRGGSEIFFVNGDCMVSVDIRTEPELRVGRPETLFVGGFDTNPAEVQNYDISLDGRSFIMVEGVEEAAPDRIQVVVNWLRVLNELTSPAEEQ
jgi:Tol biopolymer transport system component/predicted Ser/Thr protein kinase